MFKFEPKSFEEALATVDREINAFQDKAFAEQLSQTEKNMALYAALDKAYAFHSDWAAQPEYAKFLASRNVVDVPRGAKSSQFTPTIKAFFDPTWDGLAAATDEEKRDKARRQKTISTYSAVLDYAAHERINDVASFIATGGGIEAMRVKWRQKRSERPEAVKQRQNAEASRKQRLDTGLANLQNGMQVTLPSDATLKDEVRLAAVYFDENGVAHFLGLPEHDEGAKGLLDEFILSHAGMNPLQKLLTLLKVGAVANPKDANVLIKNDPTGCSIHAAQNSYEACVIAAKLPHQDFLPDGTYWFGTKAVRGLKRLASLGKHGAHFTISACKIDGIDAATEVLVTDYQLAIAAIPDWDWNKARPQSHGSRHTENDGVMTITSVSTVEEMAHIKPISAWSGDAKVEGEFAAWLQATLGVTPDDVNQRLAKAIRDEGRPTTALRITERAWTITDKDGDVARCPFPAPIGKAKFTVDITVGSKEVLRAVDTVKALIGVDEVAISVVDGLLRVHAESGESAAEVFIPAIGESGRYRAYTEFESLPI